MKPMLDGFPMLRHDNLLKHYIFGHEKGGDNHHTWGYLWMKTVHAILGENFEYVFFLASQPGVRFDQLMGSPMLQIGSVLEISENTDTRLFRTQKRRSSVHTYVFPSCVIEYENDAFHLEKFLIEN